MRIDLTLRLKKSLITKHLFLFFLHIPQLKAQEEIVFDKTIDWQWKFPLWYGGNSFYWWHHPAGSVTDYGNMPTDDWTTPYDYENGTYYLRFEVLEQPTDNAFTIQFGIWQDERKAGGWSECVSKPAKISGGAGSFCAVNVGSPASWWQKRPDVKVDFTRPEDFYRIGMVLWRNGSCIPMAQGWKSTRACQDAEMEAAKFFPMRARVTVVAVASGHTFSGRHDAQFGDVDGDGDIDIVSKVWHADGPVYHLDYWRNELK